MEKKQIIKPQLKPITKIVVKDIDRILTKPCPIHYPIVENPNYQDLKNTLKIQRHIIENDCNVRLKAIENL